MSCLIEDILTNIPFETEMSPRPMSSMYSNRKREAVFTTIIVVFDINRRTAANTILFLWANGEFYEAPLRESLEILDRVGGGDSFASGLIYDLLTMGEPQTAGKYGAAHGAFAMTIPDNTTIETVKEVEKS
jgi:sugar/nucleoside kinase (ribokinase family)